MHYFIDGYNLLFRLLRANDDLQAQREKIIAELSQKVQFLSLNVTLVFDAQHQLGDGSKSHFRDLEIQFTPQGDTADDSIIKALKHCKDPRKETVVTSDKKLAWRARRKSALSETVEEFMAWLNRRYKNKIRQLSQKAAPSLTRAPAGSAPPLLPKKKAPTPNRKALPEDCLDYYEEIFERKLLEIVHVSSSQKGAKKKKSNKKLINQAKAPPLEADLRSDMERWLDIFEKSSKAEPQ